MPLYRRRVVRRYGLRSRRFTRYPIRRRRYARKY